MKRSITIRLLLAAQALSAPLLLLTALPAVGQDGTRADIQQARADAAASTGRGSLVSRYAFASADAGTGPDLGLTLNGLWPIYYNSNAEAIPSGGTKTAETNPEFRLSWAKQLQQMPIKLTALVDANSDRYARSNGADGDLTYGKFRAQYITGNNDQEFEPFVNYGPKSAFTPTFEAGTTATHDFTIGFDKAFNYDYMFRRIGSNSPFGISGDTSGATVWSFGFTGTLTRRLTNAGQDSIIATASPSVTYNLTNLPNANATDAQWNVSLGTNISRRWYDKSGSMTRMDWVVNPVLTIEFVPPSSWFKGVNEHDQDASRKALGKPVIDFQLAFAQDSSNQAAHSFHQWSIGPMLKTGWKF
jgi:hypothetical protein